MARICINNINNYINNGLIYKTKHPIHNIYTLNYSDKCQWENAWDEITLQARAIVVDDEGNIVARPFKKFFNLSEGRTNVTDSYVIYEKLDGSFIQLFWYENDWVVSSRGSFTSEQAVWAEEILKEYNLMYLDRGLTFCFELIHKSNRIVVDYGDLNTLILTGVFDTITGEEIDVDAVSIFEKVNRLDHETPLTELHTLIKDNEEGYVIRFSNGERCKIKGAEYLRLHKAMSEMSTTAIWECLMNGTSVVDAIQELPDEFYQLVKDYEKELEQEYNQVEEDIFKQYISLVKDVDDKTFALSIENHPLKNFFFSLRNKKDVEKTIWKKIKPNFRKL